MLRFIIALSIVSFCESAEENRSEIRYSQLILVHHYPITSFFVRHNSYRTVNFRSSQYAEYLRDHWDLFQKEKWIIHGLRSLNENHQYIIFCKNASGVIPVYNDSNINPDLRKEMREKWPVLKLTTTESTHWKLMYNVHGSCISANESSYFQEGIDLLGQYDLGQALRDAEINPGGIYPLELIDAALQFVLHAQPYIKCLPAKESRAQYLLEIQVCYNPNHEVVNCFHRRHFPLGIHFCDTEVPVIYPETPTYPLPPNSTG